MRGHSTDPAAIEAEIAHSPRDPNDEDDYEDEDKENEDRSDEPAVVREPDDE
jgi:hypothetical protein